MQTDSPSALAGHHPETAALSHVLRAAGIQAPHTGEAFSEAMLLGLGGGISASYFVFEYAGMLPTFYVATRCHPQYAYTKDFAAGICEHLGLAPIIKETSSAKAARQHLDTLLAERGCVMAWVNRNALPYLPRAEFADGLMPHALAITQQDSTGDYRVLDLASVSLTVSATELAFARSQHAKARHALLAVAPGEATNLEQAIVQGITRCLGELEGAAAPKNFASNFGLAAIAKWRDLARDPKGKKGWAKVFPAGAALYTALRYGYHWIETADTGGGAFRGLYAQFLQEAAPLFPGRPFQEAAEQYRALAQRWTSLATELLPSDVPMLHETRLALEEKRRLFISHGGDAMAERRMLDERLAALRKAAETDFPYDQQSAQSLYERLANTLDELLDAERNAANTLREAVRGL